MTLLSATPLFTHSPSRPPPATQLLHYSVLGLQPPYQRLMHSPVPVHPPCNIERSLCAGSSMSRRGVKARLGVCSGQQGRLFFLFRRVHRLLRSSLAVVSIVMNTPKKPARKGPPTKRPEELKLHSARPTSQSVLQTSMDLSPPPSSQELGVSSDSRHVPAPSVQSARLKANEKRLRLHTASHQVGPLSPPPSTEDVLLTSDRARVPGLTQKKQAPQQPPPTVHHVRVSLASSEPPGGSSSSSDLYRHGGPPGLESSGSQRSSVQVPAEGRSLPSSQSSGTTPAVLQAVTTAPPRSVQQAQAWSARSQNLEQLWSDYCVSLSAQPHSPNSVIADAILHIEARSAVNREETLRLGRLMARVARQLHLTEEDEEAEKEEEAHS